MVRRAAAEDEVQRPYFQVQLSMSGFQHHSALTYVFSDANDDLGHFS